jgi:hypothetical protein
MAAATVWWAWTSWSNFGTTGISYDGSTGALSGRVTGDGQDQSGSFLLTAAFWLPAANYPAEGCKFRSTPGANLSGNAFVGTLEGSKFLWWETDAPRAQCQVRATQHIFAGQSLIASGTNLQVVATLVGDYQTATGTLPVQPFPTLDFDLDRTQDLGIQLQLNFENSIVHSYQTWWGFPAICRILLPQWEISSIT